MHWIIDYYSEEVRLEIDYLPVGKKIVVLHSFIKKTDETPKRELDLARRRQKEITES